MEESRTLCFSSNTRPPRPESVLTEGMLVFDLHNKIEYYTVE